ncbi:hypothetical protein OsJ_12788 [Oryza sativa Japonica Group]|uniref:Uncharacterized protein n=1 Tax=Oryza sativa subsp. japonica TaxID=39947 RepID=B9F5Z4_ORYSJ|nr:hypothetical protein OsJ_12788 [Oryza sativa Japonica Group]
MVLSSAPRTGRPGGPQSEAEKAGGKLEPAAAALLPLRRLRLAPGRRTPPAPTASSSEPTPPTRSPTTSCPLRLRSASSMRRPPPPPRGPRRGRRPSSTSPLLALPPSALSITATVVAAAAAAARTVPAVQARAAELGLDRRPQWARRALPRTRRARLRVGARFLYGHGDKPREARVLDEAVVLFFAMADDSGVCIDIVAAAAVAFSACTQIGDLALGREAHRRVAERKVALGFVAWNALVDMYTKCGDAAAAHRCFRRDARADQLVEDVEIDVEEVPDEDHGSELHRPRNAAGDGAAVRLPATFRRLRGRRGRRHRHLPRRGAAVPQKWGREQHAPAANAERQHAGDRASIERRQSRRHRGRRTRGDMPPPRGGHPGSRSGRHHGLHLATPRSTTTRPRFLGRNNGVASPDQIKSIDRTPPWTLGTRARWQEDETPSATCGGGGVPAAAARVGGEARVGSDRQN